MKNGMARFEVNSDEVTPEYVGSCIVSELKTTAERNLGFKVNKVVLSVPAEFDEMQRNYTRKAAELAGD